MKIFSVNICRGIKEVEKKDETLKLTNTKYTEEYLILTGK